MRKLFLVSALLLSLSQQAQTDAPQKESTQKHELGLNLFAMDLTTVGLNLRYTSHVVPGMYYKYHFGENAFRFSFNYLQNDLNRIQPAATYNDYTTGHQEQLKIGYQRSLIATRFNLFVFADLLFGAAQQKNYSYPDHNYNYDYSIPPSSYSMNAYICGGDIGVGFSYQLRKHLALTYELSFNASNITNRYSNIFSFSPIKQLGLAVTF